MPRKGEKCSEATKRSIRRSQTKYRSSYCGEIIDWFIAPRAGNAWRAYIDVYRVVEGEVIDGKVPVFIPTLTGFCDYIGVSLPTLYKWIDTYEEFADAYEEAMEIKREKINIYALQGEVNATFAKYMLESWHPRERKRPQTEAEGISEQAQSAADSPQNAKGNGMDINFSLTIQSPENPFETADEEKDDEGST